MEARFGPYLESLALQIANFTGEFAMTKSKIHNKHENYIFKHFEMLHLFVTLIFTHNH